MKKKPRHAPHLRLVPVPPPESERREPVVDSRGQLQLFDNMEAPPVTIYVANLITLSAGRFVDSLRELKPKWIIDLRVFAYFNIDRLTRQYVFRLFEEQNANYRNVADQVGAISRKDAVLNAAVVVHELTRILTKAGGSQAIGPILVLLDDDEHVRQTIEVFPKLLEPKPKGGWRAQMVSDESLSHLIAHEG